MADSQEYARITADGSIFMGKNFCADGFSFQRKYSVYTHIHTDHIQNFDSSLGYCEKIFASKATIDLLKAMKGDYLSIRNNIAGLPYEKPFTLNGETITLFPAVHILGSAQVLVESDGQRIVYTGDFDSPGTHPIQCDILIIDSTHGTKKYNYSMIEKDEAKAKLFHLVRSFRQESDLPILIRAYRGRLQNVMHDLRKIRALNGVLFISSKMDYNISKVYQEYGFASTPIEEVNFKIPIAKQIGDTDYVAFLPFNAARKLDKTHNVIEVNSYGVSGSYSRISDKRYRLFWSDHADFNGIIEYIKQSGANTVITDVIRGQGYPLADYINNELDGHIKAIPGGHPHRKEN